MKNDCSKCFVIIKIEIVSNIICVFIDIAFTGIVKIIKRIYIVFVIKIINFSLRITIS